MDSLRDQRPVRLLLRRHQRIETHAVAAQTPSTMAIAKVAVFDKPGWEEADEGGDAGSFSKWATAEDVVRLNVVPRTTAVDPVQGPSLRSSLMAVTM